MNWQIIITEIISCYRSDLIIAQKRRKRQVAREKGEA